MHKILTSGRPAPAGLQLAPPSMLLDTRHPGVRNAGQRPPPDPYTTSGFCGSTASSLTSSAELLTWVQVTPPSALLDMLYPSSQEPLTYSVFGLLGATSSTR